MAEFTLDDLVDGLDAMSKNFTQARKELVEEVGDDMYQAVLKNIEADTEARTGNLKRGVDKVIGSSGGYSAVRNKHSVAPHAHLLEEGHRIVTRSGVDTGKVTTGKFMYRNALNTVKPTAEAKAEAMMERLVKEF